MPPALVTTAVVGRDRGSLRTVLLLALGLGLASFVGASVVRRLAPASTASLDEVFYPLFLTEGDPLRAVAIVGGWIAFAGVVSYRQGGLVAGWAIVFGPLFGGLANVFLARNLCCAGATTSPAVLRATYSPYAYVANGFAAFAAALAYALVLGTIGYVLATGARTVLQRGRVDEA